MTTIDPQQDAMLREVEATFARLLATKEPEFIARYGAPIVTAQEAGPKGCILSIQPNDTVPAEQIHAFRSDAIAVMQAHQGRGTRLSGHERAPGQVGIFYDTPQALTASIAEGKPIAVAESWAERCRVSDKQFEEKVDTQEVHDLLKKVYQRVQPDMVGYVARLPVSVERLEDGKGYRLNVPSAGTPFGSIINQALGAIWATGCARGSCPEIGSDRITFPSYRDMMSAMKQLAVPEIGSQRR